MVQPGSNTICETQRLDLLPCPKRYMAPRLSLLSSYDHFRQSAQMKLSDHCPAFHAQISSHSKLLHCICTSHPRWHIHVQPAHRLAYLYRLTNLPSFPTCIPQQLGCTHRRYHQKQTCCMTLHSQQLRSDILHHNHPRLELMSKHVSTSRFLCNYYTAGCRVPSGK